MCVVGGVAVAKLAFQMEECGRVGASTPDAVSFGYPQAGSRVSDTCTESRQVGVMGMLLTTVAIDSWPAVQSYRPHPPRCFT